MSAPSSQILGMQLVTHQTGPEGQKVRRLLIEEGADIEKELYVGMVVDRGTQRVCLMASSEGGMDIEEVAAKTPHKIHKVFVDPQLGLTDGEADSVSRHIGIPEASLEQARQLLQALYKCFWETDASLAEINPLIYTGEGHVIALDSKMNFDDNALGRHPDIVAMRDQDEEDPLEAEASAHHRSYVSLEGGIGCMVNGAGLAMATMDPVKLFGGEPANFLDVGGGRDGGEGHRGAEDRAEGPERQDDPGQHLRRHRALRPRGRRDAPGRARGPLSGPMVMRMIGTNEDRGKKLLEDTDLP